MYVGSRYGEWENGEWVWNRLTPLKSRSRGDPVSHVSRMQDMLFKYRHILVQKWVHHCKIIQCKILLPSHWQRDFLGKFIPPIIHLLCTWVYMTSFSHKFPGIVSIQGPTRTKQYTQDSLQQSNNQTNKQTNNQNAWLFSRSNWRIPSWFLH